jgi:endosialidase-like protein
MRLTGGRIALAAGAVLWGLVGGGPGRAEAGGEEGAFIGLTPCRLADTLGNGFADPFGPPALAAGVARDFPVQGQCGVPVGALAISLNVTATGTQGPGFLLLYPQGGAQPLVSTLNYVGGETVANAAIVPLGAGGLTVIAGVSGTDLILDVNGYFTDSLVHGQDSGSLFVGGGAGNLGNSTGGSNTAVGTGALFRNTDGGGNTGIGAGVLFANTSGSSNTAIGSGALFGNATGSNNIALGLSAGSQPTAGVYNIHIGHTGAADDISTVRIGTPGLQSRTFIAGIRAVLPMLDYVPVVIDSEGRLGAPVVTSSRRVKTDIEPVGERSRSLHALRPVSFRFRAHGPDGPVEYGLIAEEVAEVYPELVGRDAEGAPQSVRYQALPALLLNELQRLAAELQAERTRRVDLAAALAELAAEVAQLKAQGLQAGRRHGENP